MVGGAPGNAATAAASSSQVCDLRDFAAQFPKDAEELFEAGLHGEHQRIMRAIVRPVRGAIMLQIWLCDSQNCRAVRVYDDSCEYGADHAREGAGGGKRRCPRRQ